MSLIPSDPASSGACDNKAFEETEKKILNEIEDTNKYNIDHKKGDKETKTITHDQHNSKVDKLDKKPDRQTKKIGFKNFFPTLLLLLKSPTLVFLCLAYTQNQNQNCYWWHVQMTIIHQDMWWGNLIPSPYKRSELSNRVFCSLSSRKESICKWIPISNSLGKEAALVNVSISKGGLKCHRVVISDMPNGSGGTRSFVGILAAPFTTFVKHYDSTISPPFFSEIPTLVVLECESCSQFHRGSCLLQI